MTPLHGKIAVARKVLRSLALGILAVVAGCSRPGTPVVPPSPDRVVAVTVVKPERKTLHRVIEQPARVEAFEETPLVSRISGYVQKVSVDSGDRVRGPRFNDKGKLVEPGQVLAELSVPEMEEELKQKRALVAQAEAEVEQAVAALEAAEANITTAQAMVREAEAARARALANYERWESEYKRIDGLVQRKVIDEQTRDEARNQHKAAGATCQEVEAKVHSAQAAAKESGAKRNKARADITSAKARVQVARAEEGRVAALLEYSKIRAPFDGVVTRRHIHTGHFLQPSSNAAQPLFVIARTDIVRVLVEVPEADAMLIREGASARVRCQIIKGQEFEGKVTRSSWSFDPKSRTLRTEIDLSNPQGKLRPGMYAYVTFLAELPSTFTLPASAVLTQGGESYCYCVENGKAVRTPVKVGAREGQLVQILNKRTTGLADGSKPEVWADLTGTEEFALTNQGSLSDGQEVTVERKQ